MDDMNALRCRNVQLETELRIVKEQLAQAQSGTQYLVNCISNQSSLFPLGQADYQAELRLARVENSLLKQQLGLTSGLNGNINSNIANGKLNHFHSIAKSHIAPHHGLEDGKVQVSMLGGGQEDDLLTFDGDERPTYDEAKVSGSVTPGTDNNASSSLIDSPIDTPLTPWSPNNGRKTTLIQTKDGEPDGLGIFNVDYGDDLSQAHISHYRGDFGMNGYLFDPFTGVALQPQNDSSVKEDFSAWQPLQRPSSPPSRELIFDRAFADHEHRRLSGMAVFIEDMSEVAQESYWKDIAGKLGRHSAEEWKLYYEEVVRPEYLQKVAEREKVDGVGRIGALTDENVEVSPVKASPDPVIRQEDSNKREYTAVPETGLKDSMWAYTAKNGANNTNLQAGHDGENKSDDEADVESAAYFSAEESDESPSKVKDSKSLESCNISVSGGRDNKSTEFISESPGSADSAHASSSEGIEMPTRSSKTAPLAAIANRLMATSSGVPVQPPRYPRNRGRRSLVFQRGPADASDLFFYLDSKEEDLLHTVLISNIPANITLHEIVSKVRGGKIVSATFLETAGMRTNPLIETNGVLIIFLGSSRAKAYVKFCQENPVEFYAADFQDPTKACVSLIPTPTRPLNQQLLHDLRGRDLTRVLFIIDSEKLWTPDEVVVELLRGGVKMPLEAKRDEDGVLCFEFADVRDAAAAWNVVNANHWFFGEAMKGFLPDPCARPLGTLKDDGLKKDAENEEEKEKGEEREDDGKEETVQ